MVAINTNPAQDKDLREWRATGGYTFPVALSSAPNFARTTYGVTGEPTNLLLNAEGKVVFRHLGYGTGYEKTMEAEIRELLGLDPFADIEAGTPSEAAAKK